MLLVPKGLADHLTPEQLDAVLAHESRHVRCRDNLSAAVHMCVEALCWFHPAVWLIGAKLTEERERDCDEAVLGHGSQPGDYAQGILNVCRMYVESPLRCVAGIGGSDLKKRIRWDYDAARARAGDAFAAKWCSPLRLWRPLSIPVVIGVVRAQSLPPDPKYGYEVVSIHPAAPGQIGENFNLGPMGGLRTRNTSVVAMLQWAYEIPEYRFVGAPRWASSERYDIALTPDKPDIALTPETSTAQGLGSYHRNQERSSCRAEGSFWARIACRDARDASLCAYSGKKRKQVVSGTR